MFDVRALGKNLPIGQTDKDTAKGREVSDGQHRQSVVHQDNMDRWERKSRREKVGGREMNGKTGINERMRDKQKE